MTKAKELLEILEAKSKMYAIFAYDTFEKANIMKAEKVNGRWMVGGDIAPLGKKILIIAKNKASNNDWAFFSLMGNRIKFGDFLTEDQIKELP